MDNNPENVVVVARPKILALEGRVIIHDTFRRLPTIRPSKSHDMKLVLVRLKDILLNPLLGVFRRFDDCLPLQNCMFQNISLDIFVHSFHHHSAIKQNRSLSPCTWYQFIRCLTMNVKNFFVLCFIGVEGHHM